MTSGVEKAARISPRTLVVGKSRSVLIYVIVKKRPAYKGYIKWQLYSHNAFIAVRSCLVSIHYLFHATIKGFEDKLFHFPQF